MVARTPAGGIEIARAKRRGISSRSAGIPYRALMLQYFEDFEKNAVLNFEEIEKNRIKNFEEIGIYAIFALLE